MKDNYKLIDRKEFTEKRYANFLNKKKYLKESGIGEIAYLTDLDKLFIPATKDSVATDSKKLLRDVVICDRCNEDILEENFVMFDDNFVYHPGCIKSDLPKDFKLEMGNVVFVDFKIHR